MIEKCILKVLDSPEWQMLVTTAEIGTIRDTLTCGDINSNSTSQFKYLSSLTIVE